MENQLTDAQQQQLQAALAAQSKLQVSPLSQNINQHSPNLLVNQNNMSLLQNQMSNQALINQSQSFQNSQQVLSQKLLEFQNQAFQNQQMNEEGQQSQVQNRSISLQQEGAMQSNIYRGTASNQNRSSLVEGMENFSSQDLQKKQSQNLSGQRSSSQEQSKNSKSLLQKNQVMIQNQEDNQSSKIQFRAEACLSGDKMAVQGNLKNGQQEESKVQNSKINSQTNSLNKMIDKRDFQVQMNINNSRSCEKNNLNSLNQKGTFGTPNQIQQSYVDDRQSKNQNLIINNQFQVDSSYSPQENSLKIQQQNFFNIRMNQNQHFNPYAQNQCQLSQNQFNNLVREAELQKRYTGYFNGMGGMTQQNMMYSESDIEKALYGAINSHSAQNDIGKVDSFIGSQNQMEPFDPNAESINQVQQAFQSLKIQSLQQAHQNIPRKSMMNNNSMIGVKNQMPQLNHVNPSQLPIDIQGMLPNNNNRISQIMMSNQIQYQQMQALQINNQRDINQPLGIFQNSFHQLSNQALASSKLDQVFQNVNPNLNEVMNLDPIDGRELKGRCKSRDTSNSRVVGLQQIPHIQNNLQQFGHNHLMHHAHSLNHLAIRNNFGNLFQGAIPQNMINGQNQNIPFCMDCFSQQQYQNPYDFIYSFQNDNFENLECIKQKANLLHLQRQGIHDISYRNFKTQIREEVLKLKRQNVQALEDASSRILQLINKGEMRNFEKEMEIYQHFVNNKIMNFNQRVQQTIDSAKIAQQNQMENGAQLSQQQVVLSNQSGVLRHQVQNLTIDKDKVDNFDKEVQSISEQIKFKQEYFEKIQEKILNKIDLSSFQGIKMKIHQAERSLEQYSKDNRIAVFVPNRKQIIMHDLKYFTSKTIDLKHVEHPFGNFSTILQCSMNGKIYICGGKQRRKLFEFDERNLTLIERSEMINGRSNHAFVEIPMTGELIAIGGWDGERAMAQTEGFSIRTNQWKQLPKLAEERHSLTACLLGQSFIYAIGGSSAINYGSSLCTIERINFAQPNYMQLTSWELIYLNGEFQDQKRSQLGSIAISDDQIMIFGGFLDTDLTNQCYIIDHNRQSIQKMKKPVVRASQQILANQNRQQDQDFQRRDAPQGQDRRVQQRVEVDQRIARNDVRAQENRVQGVERNFENQRQPQQNVADQNLAAIDNNDQAVPENVVENQEQQFVIMKKSKKFIKFKDFIIKLPNSMGLMNSRNQSNMNNDVYPFADQHPQNQIQNHEHLNEHEGPGQIINQNFTFLMQNNIDQQIDFEQNNRDNKNQKEFKDKGYSIYVVDDEHEIHRFDLETQEWTIISTTKESADIQNNPFNKFN